LDRLGFFQEKLGLTPEELSSLEPHRDVFLAHRDGFAEYLHDVLSGIPETRRIVDLMEAQGGLRKNWRGWYEMLFTESFTPRFYEFLWNSGLKHVSRSVDQRFIHLGYCMGRLFLGEIIDREVPQHERHRVSAVIDKMMEVLFYHLLRNSLQAVEEAAAPVVRVTGAAEGSPPAALTAEIFNNGRVPLAEEVEHLFTPFYSSRPTGSGFGLPIAALIVRKIRGEIDLRPVAGEGTRTVVSLPVHPD
jgi:signal transduction histidine kinase